MKEMRIYQLMKFCLQEYRVTSLQELAEKVHVSVATIRLDLEHMETLAKEWNLTIIRKRGVGFLIQGEVMNRQHALQEIERQMDKHREQEDEVFYQIIFFLLQNINKQIRISDISHGMFVSDSVIQKKLQQVHGFIQGTDVKLEIIKNKGLRLLGSEQDIRSLFAHMIMKQKNQETVAVHYPQNVKQQILDILHIQPEPLFLAIQNCEKELSQYFSDESLNSLAVHIAIAIKRTQEGRSVPHQEVIDYHDFLKEYQAAVHLCEELNDRYQVRFNEDEIYYLFLHLISTKVIGDYALLPASKDSDDVVKQIAIGIVELVNNMKQVNIEQKYMDTLLIHLRPTINRLAYGIELKNPLLAEIRREFPESYGIAWMCNAIFQKILRKSLTEDEAGYIAIHVQAMIESTMEYVRLVIVCSSGIGISQLLSTQIEKRFKRIMIHSIDSLASFQKKAYGKEVDLVISTFPLETKLAQIVVEPFLSAYNVQQINDFIVHHREYHHSNELLWKTMIHPAWDSQDIVIHEVSKRLLAEDVVRDGFEASVWRREAICSTSIGMQVALPHGDFDQIKKSCVVVITLAKPILWKDDLVDVILFILICEEDVEGTTPILKNLYRTLYSEIIHKELVGAVRDEQIWKCLK